MNVTVLHKMNHFFVFFSFLAQNETEKDQTGNGDAVKCPFTQNGSAGKEEITAGGDKKTD